MTDRAFQAKNVETSEQLNQLLAQRTEAELQREVSHGWTIAATLVHLAFWDLRALVLLEQFEKTGVKLSAMDIEVANEVVQRMANAITPVAARQLWLETATRLDQRIEALPDSLIDAIHAAGNPFNLPRHAHRAEHFAEIQKVL
ncbi:MAG: maleylpyruvate isomerase N-terminal domain-containing protein [Chloroflexi bacterium]|nr:maleylpyruvate isomerase N-terminal domain-containing protein [Chloroflexota bacterium]